MKPCEICEKKSVEEDKQERISYYDFCDLGTALGLSITTPLADMDLSRVIAGCKKLPDDKSFERHY